MTDHKNEHDDGPEPKTWAELHDMIDRGVRGAVIPADKFWESRLSFFEDWPLETLPPHVAEHVMAARKRYGKED